MSKINGPFEVIGAVVLGIAGLHMGYQIGSEAVVYARTITENQDVLTYIVNQHPSMTKLISTLGVGSVMCGVGRAGTLVDMIFGTYKK